MGELSSELEILTYDKDDASLTYQDRNATIPESHKTINSGAANRGTLDGKYVYSSNRGHDSIAAFKVSDTDQSLSLIEIIPSEGNVPRDFNLTPDNGYVIVAHQDSDNLTLFTRDDLTGKLTLLQKDVYAPECVCIKF